MAMVMAGHPAVELANTVNWPALAPCGERSGLILP